MDTLKSKRKKASSECGFVWTIQGFRIAVVDDRFDWRLRVKREIALLVGNKILIDEYESGENFLKEDQIYDLILLDVEMKGKDGFETAAIYAGKHDKCLIAFVTNHTEFWKEGYRVNAFRYIEKDNIREEIAEMLAACQRIFSKKKKMYVSGPKGTDIEIRVDNIIYIEANKPYTTLHMKQGVIDSNDHMVDILKEVKDNGFMQCHRSYIVNFDEIKEIDDNIIFLKNGERIQISERKKREFMKGYISYKFSVANQ